MKSNQKRFLIPSLLVTSLLLTACAPAADPNTSENTEVNNNNVETAEEESNVIQIGGIAPLTGDGADYGVPAQRVAQIALDKINAEGGINGKNLEIIWEDGKCNPQDASEAANKLINVDKVQIIWGAFCSSETLAAAPLAEEAGVLMLSPGSSSPEVTNAGDYIFRNYPSDSSQSVTIANTVFEAGKRKVGILTEENDYTIGLGEVFEEKFTELGGEVITETYLPDDTDFKTQITKLKSEGIDAFFVNSQTPNKTDLILKQLSELGADDLQLIGNDVALGSTESLERYSDLVEGMIGAEVSYNTDSESFKYFTEEYQNRHGEEVPFTTYAATEYDAIILLAEGLTTYGNDADAIKDWLYTIDGWEGAAGSLTIDENGDPTSGHLARMVQNGETIPYSN